MNSPTPSPFPTAPVRGITTKCLNFHLNGHLHSFFNKVPYLFQIRIISKVKRIFSVSAGIFLFFSRMFRHHRWISLLATAPTWCWSHPRPALTTPPERAFGSRWSDASDQTVPSLKIDYSQPLRGTRILTTSLASQFNACSFDYRNHGELAQSNSLWAFKDWCLGCEETF